MRNVPAPVAQIRKMCYTGGMNVARFAKGVRRKCTVLAFPLILLAFPAHARQNVFPVPSDDAQAREVFESAIASTDDAESFSLWEKSGDVTGSFWRTDGEGNTYFLVAGASGGRSVMRMIRRGGEVSFLTPPAGNVVHFDVSSDGAWVFLELLHEGERRPELVCMDAGSFAGADSLSDASASAREPSVLVGLHGGVGWYNSSLRYSGQSDTLYFYIYPEPQRVNGDNVYYDYGLYAVRRSGGAFSAQSVRRFFKPADWLLERAENAFLGNGANDTEGWQAFRGQTDAISAEPPFTKQSPFHAWLLRTDDGIWLFAEESVMTGIVDGREVWECGYLTPIYIEDSDGNVPRGTADPLGGTKIASPQKETFPVVAASGGALVFKPLGEELWRTYKNGAFADYGSYRAAVSGAKRLAQDGSGSAGSVPLAAAVVPWVLCALLLGLLLFVLSRRFSRIITRRNKRFVFRTQEEVRAKISQDIHDTVVQNIRAVAFETETLEVREASEEKKRRITQELTELIVLLRNICYNLRPAELSLATDDAGLLSILDTLCRQFIDRTKIPCTIQLEKDFVEPKLGAETVTHIARTVQEALSNIEKHSYATAVQVVIQHDGGRGISIFIIDDGIGCDTAKLGKSRLSFGIRQMREHIAATGGSIEFFSTPNEGLSVHLTVPCESDGGGQMYRGSGDDEKTRGQA